MNRRILILLGLFALVAAAPANARKYWKTAPWTLKRQVLIDGKADEIQLQVQGHSTQTSDVVVFENSAGTDLFTIDNSGNVAITGTLAASGAQTQTAAFSVDLDDTTDGVVNNVTLSHTSSDNNATAGDAVGISVELENATGTSTVEQWFALHFESTTITDGAEDGDFVVQAMLNGSVTEALRLDASDQSLSLGQNATDADGINKLRIFPLTTAKGSFVIQATDQTGDTAFTLTADAHGQATTLHVADGGASDAYVVQSTAAVTLAEADVLDGATAGTAVASKAVVVDANVGVAGLGLVEADVYRVANASTLTAANPQLTKANLQAASFWGVDTSSNAVDVDLAEDAAMDAADVGSRKTFAVTTGHATQALTVTAGSTGITTVTTIDTLGTSCEDAGDIIECVITTTATATCFTYCADS